MLALGGLEAEPGRGLLALGVVEAELVFTALRVVGVRVRVRVRGGQGGSVVWWPPPSSASRAIWLTCSSGWKVDARKLDLRPRRASAWSGGEEPCRWKLKAALARLLLLRRSYPLLLLRWNPGRERGDDDDRAAVVERLGRDDARRVMLADAWRRDIQVNTM